MLRSAPARQLTRLAASCSPTILPPRFLAPCLARFNSTSPVQSAFASTPLAAAQGLPDRTTPAALQRPQKHKAKKAKAHKQPSPSSPALNSDASLLPVGLRTPTQRRRRPADGKVIALTTAESYDTAELLQRLQAMGLLEDAVNLVGEAVLLPNWTPAAVTFFDSDTAAGGATSAATLQEHGEVYVFESGTIVVWGLSMDAAEVFLRKVIRGAGGASSGFVEVGRYAEPETEVLEYWVADGPTHMSGDSIHLSSPPSEEVSASSAASSSSPATPSKALLERLAFSAGMARVTKLGVYEEQFDAFAEGVAGIPKLLESGSESPVKKTDIIKRVGTLHSFRQKLNLEDENLLDEPEFLWEDADLHGHYTAVCKALEFENRLTTLNDRVDYAFSLQTTLMELLNTKTSHRLEWIIIILIAFEISLVLIREGLPFLSNKEEKDHAKSDIIHA
ncbi:hypothetical protein JCM10908_001984 [Rhodotorula pacifica]|uniref:RMD1 family protein n=1 Tax=Rhodotorula pacifica TaxID=1495444 RepID=UPI003174F98C